MKREIVPLWEIHPHKSERVAEHEKVLFISLEKPSNVVQRQIHFKVFSRQFSARKQRRKRVIQSHFFFVISAVGPKFRLIFRQSTFQIISLGFEVLEF